RRQCNISRVHNRNSFKSKGSVRGHVNGGEPLVTGMLERELHVIPTDPAHKHPGNRTPNELGTVAFPAMYCCRSHFPSYGAALSPPSSATRAAPGLRAFVLLVSPGARLRLRFHALAVLTPTATACRSAAACVMLLLIRAGLRLPACARAAVTAGLRL